MHFFFHSLTCKGYSLPWERVCLEVNLKNSDLNKACWHYKITGYIYLVHLFLLGCSFPNNRSFPVYLRAGRTSSFALLLSQPLWYHRKQNAFFDCFTNFEGSYTLGLNPVSKWAAVKNCLHISRVSGLFMKFPCNFERRSIALRILSPYLSVKKDSFS